MKRGLACFVHEHDSMVPQEDHHVWPTGYHGPDTRDNIVRICANAHSDVHYYLEYLLKHGGQRPANWRTWGPNIRVLAWQGYEKVMAYAESLAP